MDSVSPDAVAAALRHGSVTAVAQAVEHVTQPGWVYLAGFVCALVCWRSGRRRAAVVAVVAGAVGSVASPVTKALVGRERPALEAGLTTAGGGSYPSGHALASATVVLVLLLVLAPPARSRAVLVGRWAAGALFCLVVGVDRVWLGAHWPTDVLGGWLLAVTIASLAALGARARARDDVDEARPRA